MPASPEHCQDEHVQEHEDRTCREQCLAQRSSGELWPTVKMEDTQFAVVLSLLG